MLAIIISWLIIFFVLFSFGGILLSTLERLLKVKESYNVIEQQVLGLISLVIPLSLWSIWLPINAYCLLVFMMVSVVYWISNFDKLKLEGIRLSKIFKNFSLKEKLILLFFCLIAISIYVWEEGILDSIFYHQQAIRWSEEYAVVPGLGNLEDRLALNSNYLLISALFTFRFLFDQAIYAVNSWFVVMLGCWCIVELFRSKYELKRICLLVAFFIFFILNIKLMQNTSTDILPNVIVFYVLARLILDSSFFYRHKLLYALLPMFLITCKLSFIPFMLIALAVCWILYSEGRIRYVCLLLGLFLLILIPWLVRNVIMSGYLVYPIYQIDLFSFDWKIPLKIAESQVFCVKTVGRNYLNATLHGVLNSGRDPLWIVYMTLGLYIMSLISIILLVGSFFKKTKWDKVLLLVFVSLLFSLILWLLNGPDSRFVSGLLCLLLFFAASVCLDFSFKNRLYPNLGFGLLLSFLVFIGFWSFRQTKSRYESFALISEEVLVDRRFEGVLYRPCSFSFFLKLTSNIDSEKEVESYELNNGELIYVSKIRYAFDRIPYTAEYGTDWKLTDYHDLEARGEDLSSGFRSKLLK